MTKKCTAQQPETAVVESSSSQDYEEWFRLNGKIRKLTDEIEALEKTQTKRNCKSSLQDPCKCDLCTMVRERYGKLQALGPRHRALSAKLANRAALRSARSGMRGKDIADELESLRANIGSCADKFRRKADLDFAELCRNVKGELGLKLSEKQAFAFAIARPLNSPAPSIPPWDHF